jgi:hypothetical protein
MDESVERVMRIYQRHLVTSRIGMCCSPDIPCETSILFDQIKRLNGQIKALNALVQEMAGVPAD